MNVKETQTQVLIVGAGPTGLVLALFLARLGVKLRIVDKAAQPGSTSRALVVHARTLEFYRQLGIDQAVIESSEKFMAVNLWVDGRRRGRMAFGDIGAKLSKYPYSLIFSQDEHERLLVGELARLGIQVERPVEVVDIAPRDDKLLVGLQHADGTAELCWAAYVAGCDGAHSRVRESAGIDLPGGTYSHLWYVADVEATGPLTNHEVNVSMDDRDVIAAFPMRGTGRARLIGQAPPRPDGQPVVWEEVSKRQLDDLGTEIRAVNWFSTYRVHHRVASAFRKDRIFLLGDAAHLHSPVGGQGMNTGIGDAVNLAWKLAAVIAGASPELLASYEPERIAFARRLVATTDRVFVVLNSNRRWAQLLRTRLIPLVMPPLFRTEIGRRMAFRLLSQTGIHYRHSALSAGRARSVHGGDRLPWVLTPGDPNGFEDNFAPLSAIEWQVHFYGEASAPIRELCQRRNLRLVVFSWQPAMQQAGLTRNALYLIRPDGHVGLVDPHADAATLGRYLDRSPAFSATVRV